MYTATHRRRHITATIKGTTNYFNWNAITIWIYVITLIVCYGRGRVRGRGMISHLPSTVPSASRSSADLDENAPLLRHQQQQQNDLLHLKYYHYGSSDPEHDPSAGPYHQHNINSHSNNPKALFSVSNERKQLSVTIPSARHAGHGHGHVGGRHIGSLLTSPTGGLALTSGRLESITNIDWSTSRYDTASEHSGGFSDENDKDPEKLSDFTSLSYLNSNSGSNVAFINGSGNNSIKSSYSSNSNSHLNMMANNSSSGLVYYDDEEDIDPCSLER